MKTEEKVIEVARKIAAGEFDPKPGLVCHSCSYHSICPAHEVRRWRGGRGRAATGAKSELATSS